MAKKKAEKKPPKQKVLPGMKDRKLADLHEAALEYAAARDERMEKMKPESDAKATVLRLMKKHKKTVYRYNGVSVLLTVEKEKVTVKVTSPDETDAEVGESGFEEADQAEETEEEETEES
jgi:hypothetical protein